MPRTGLDKNTILNAAAKLANENGIEKVTLKELAEKLNIKPPSLYNHIDSLNSLKRELMLYGWRGIERMMLSAAEGVNGYEAIQLMCCSFYRYATENKGVFEAMLWYNKYVNSDSMSATGGLFEKIYTALESEGVTRDESEHIIRLLRAYLEGYSLLVNNSAFGHPFDVDESFERSVEIIISGIKDRKEIAENDCEQLR